VDVNQIKKTSQLRGVYKMVKNVTTKYFNKNVYDLKKTDDNGELKFLGKKPVLIDFYATWCGPCRILEPILDELYTEYDGEIDIYKVNTEDEIELAGSFGVMSLPTLLFIPIEGKPVISPGAPPKQMLKELIDEKLLGKEVKKDELKEQVGTFNELMDKIKKVLK
jgi:thioredoxin